MSIYNVVLLSLHTPSPGDLHITLLLIAALNKCTAKMKTNNAIESHPLSSSNGDNKATHAMEQGHAKPKRSKPKDLMKWYASSLFAVAFSGGFAVRK